MKKKYGTIYTENDAYHILDLPGTYSLSPESFDEQIVSDQVLSWASGEDPPSVIISVVDASNLSRNLFLTSQLIDLDIPVVIALNMIDRLEDVKQLDLKALQMELGVEAVVPFRQN